MVVHWIWWDGGPGETIADIVLVELGLQKADRSGLKCMRSEEIEPVCLFTKFRCDRRGRG